MDFGSAFRQLGKIDPTALEARIRALPDSAWGCEDAASRARFAFLQERRTLALIPDGGKFHLEPPPPTPVGAQLEPELAPVLAVISRFFRGRGYVHRVVVSDLAGGASISDHEVDGGRFLFVHRIHVPLSTSEKATFRVGAEARHLPAGEIWEVNNTRRHGARNDGGEPRIHLLVDWVTPDLVRRRRLRRLRRRSRRKLRRFFGLAAD